MDSNRHGLGFPPYPYYYDGFATLPSTGAASQVGNFSYGGPSNQSTAAVGVSVNISPSKSSHVSFNLNC